MPWDDKTKSSGPWGGEGGNNGGGKDGDSPWNRPGGSGGSGGNDLEEQMRRMQERFRQRGGGGGNRRGGGGGGGTNFGPLGFLVIAGIALLLRFVGRTGPRRTWTDSSDTVTLEAHRTAHGWRVE